MVETTAGTDEEATNTTEGAAEEAAVEMDSPYFLASVVLVGMLGATISRLLHWRDIADPASVTEEKSTTTTQRLPSNLFGNEIAWARLILGVVAALTAYIALTTGLLLPIGTSPPTPLFILLACFIAGFSERLLPVEELTKSPTKK